MVFNREAWVWVMSLTDVHYFFLTLQFQKGKYNTESRNLGFGFGRTQLYHVVPLLLLHMFFSGSE